MPLRSTKRFIRRTRLRLLGVGEQVQVHAIAIAPQPVAWRVHPDPLDENSVVYSFGVGSHIAWDLGMIERFGCTVHAFDPTPRSIEWIAELGQKGELPDEFIFHDHGVSNRDGIMTFYPPRRKQSFNYSSIDRGRGFKGAECVEGRVQRLQSIMTALGHQRIDVLKLDIEGGEYGVIEDLLHSDIKVGQILVEFHHNFRSVSFDRTIKAIRGLNQRGFRVFHLSPRSYEMSMINGYEATDEANPLGANGQPAR